MTVGVTLAALSVALVVNPAAFVARPSAMTMNVVVAVALPVFLALCGLDLFRVWLRPARRS